MKRIWRTTDRVPQPWKNGGGMMSTVLTSPDGADWDGFDWRIGTAVITRSGPFSEFPGLTRVFTPYRGGIVTLRLPGLIQRIAPGDAPFAFCGEAACHCDHEGPETHVLNLLTRAPYRAEVAYDASVWEWAAVARYLFALEPVAEPGLEAGDLVEVAEAGSLGTGKALHVAIRKEGARPAPSA